VITDEVGRTTREGIFASGDVVTGAKTVAEAVSFSKQSAAAIMEYLGDCGLRHEPTAKTVKRTIFP
jgi:NADPH-dependent glutamate synthase beta subunit-like oxidoreductase